MLVRFSFFLIISSLSLRAQDSSIDNLNFPKVTPLSIFLFSALIVGIAVSVVVYELRRRRKEQHEKETISETNFNLRSQAIGLDDHEKSFLRKMATLSGANELAHIHGSITLFEEAVDKEIRLLTGSPDPSRKTELEDLILSLRKKMGFVYLDPELPLPSTRNISIGQPIMVFGREKSTAIISSARVVNNRELFFTIQYDPKTESAISLRRGDPIRIVFARQGDALYDVEVPVASFERPGWIDLYHTLVLRRQQLRRDVRVDASFPLKFRLLQARKPEEKDRLGSLLHSGRILDISGGGISFINDQEIKPESLLSLNFNLPQTTVTGVQAKLLRVSPIYTADDTKYRMHMQYIDLEPAQKEKIVKFVFEKLRLRSKKE